MTNENISDLLKNAGSLKPKDLVINDLKWKYLLWAIFRRKNILFVGPTRCGKTTAAKAAASIFFEEVEENVTEEQLKALQINPNIKIEEIEEIEEI